MPAPTAPAPFTIYRSSAGSGKTRTLAREYLALALSHRHHYFRHILAVTFTNKATQEMKDRILRYLHAFAEGRDENNLGEELRKRLGLDEATFHQRANEVRSSILHDYSHFSISTIDAFFQRVIRAFTREAGVLGDYRLEVDLELVLNEVVGDLLDELGTHPQLTTWVVEFAKENLEQDKAWDVRKNLVEFSKEIFKEEFYAVEEEVLKRNSDPARVQQLHAGLRALRDDARNFFQKKGAHAIQQMKKLGVTVSDVKWGAKGSVLSLLQQYQRLRKLEDKPGGVRESGEFLDPDSWPSKTTRLAPQIRELARKELIPLLQEIIAFKKEQLPLALAADQVLANFYAYGLIADIIRKLAEYKSENNLLLLADAPRFLNRIIDHSDTPYIYEKVGSFYRNFLIDEFQDTSGMQWSNFRPLLVNTLDEGQASVVVGDVKQSIYRWRGGDLRLLQHKVEDQVGRHRVDVQHLAHNYRSARDIVAFNNILFRQLAERITEETGISLPLDAYGDVKQEPHHSEKPGFVLIRFLLDKNTVGEALNFTVRTIEDLQEKGIPLKGIAILARSNKDGRLVANHIIAHGASDKARPGCRYDVISNESLRLDGAPAVKLLLATLRYLIRPGDEVARAQLAYEYHVQSRGKAPLHDVFTNTRAADFENALPAGFSEQKAFLRKLPLFELVETLVSVFHLNERPGELSYLLAFQDLVLQFFNREHNDIETFLNWWDEADDEKRSIKVPEEVDAVRIMTIHKAKGLEFEHVIVPFCSWSPWAENNQLLWVTGDQPVFDQAGPVPVRFGKNLEKTAFADVYKEEDVRARLDSLNLMYVAFTRAIEGLHIFASKQGVGKLLQETVLATPALMEHYNTREAIYRRGEVAERKGPHKVDDSRFLTEYPTYLWRERMVIRSGHAGYFDGDTAESRERQRFGTYLHKVLSRIKTQDEIPGALAMAVASGAVPGNESGEVERQLGVILSLDKVGEWFSAEAEVRTEVPILLPGGEEHRLDRLVISGDKAVVIDYKTGVPNASDRKQVEAYAETLRAMGYADVEGYLLYLREGEVQSIAEAPKKTMKTGRGGPSQLQLDL